MKRVLPYSDKEIAIRVAKRAALNNRAAHVKHTAKTQAGRIAARQAARDAGLSLDDMLDEDIGPAIVQAFGVKTVALSRDDMVKIEELTQRAEEEIPSTIRSERWRPGDCGCEVERVYHAETPEESQTFAAIPCAVHLGLSLEELHDVLEAETVQRAELHQWLHDEFADDLMVQDSATGEVAPRPSVVSYAWEGSGKERRARPVLAPHVRIDSTKVAGKLAELTTKGR